MNIMICIILICVVGYMFHRAVINRTHRHALKSTQQQHHIIIFTTSQYHNNGSSQNQHIKKKNRRQHTIIHEFISKSYPYKKGILKMIWLLLSYDGSDEPHTSACSHLLVGLQKLACNNNNNNNGMSVDGRNHDGSMIYVFTSRVKRMVL